MGLHPDEFELYRSLPMQAKMFGLEVDSPPEPDLWFEHGQKLAVGGLELEVRHTPPPDWHDGRGPRWDRADAGGSETNAACVGSTA